MITRISACGLVGGVGDSFGTTNGFPVQFPLVKRLSTALPRKISIQRALRFRESILGFLSRTASSVIRVLHPLHELLDLKTCQRVRIRLGIPSVRFIGSFDFVAPVGLRGPIQFVQSCIGCVCDFSYGALAKQPREHRPLHGFGHQGSGFFEFWKLSHSQKNITSQERKVQSAMAGLASYA